MNEKPAPTPVSNRRLENLQRGKGFQKGVSGNPAGRVKGSENRATKLTRAYAEWLEQMVASGEMTNAEAVAWRMGNIALTAKPGAAIQAAKEIKEAVEGKAMQSVRFQGGIDGPTAALIASMAQQMLGSNETRSLHGEHCYCLPCQQNRTPRQLEAPVVTAVIEENGDTNDSTLG